MNQKPRPLFNENDEFSEEQAKILLGQRITINNIRLLQSPINKLEFSTADPFFERCQEYSDADINIFKYYPSK